MNFCFKTEMESDCEMEEENNAVESGSLVPSKKLYTHRVQVLQDLLDLIPRAFFFEYQVQCLFKNMCIKLPREKGECSKKYRHRIEVEMNTVMNAFLAALQKLGTESMILEDNVHFGTHWTVAWINGVAKNFVYCILCSFYVNGVNTVDDISSSNPNRRQRVEQALHDFEYYLRDQHENKWKNSLITMSSVSGHNDREKETRSKILSVVTIERYVLQATDFFIILGLLPITVNEVYRPIYSSNLEKRPKKSMVPSPRGNSKSIVSAILESDIYRYIDKCIDNIKNQHSSIFLPRKKNSVSENNENCFWVKLDDYYKWLVLIFVQATALKAESIVGSADDASGALKIESVCLTTGTHYQYKLTIHISRLQTVPGGENVVLLSSGKRYCPVKMMMIWLAVRNVFKLPFTECLDTGNFDIKDDCKSEWLFPQSDQNGGIKSRVWSCNVIANAVEHFAKVMNLQKLSVGVRSLRKGRVVQIYCSLIRGGFAPARRRLCNALKRLPGWDNDVIYSQLKTPLYTDRTLCQGYDQLIEIARKNGSEPPDPISEVPSILDVANHLIPEEFDKTEAYIKLFEEDYSRKYNSASLNALKADVDFLTEKEELDSNPYSAKRLELLRHKLNYRLSATHKSDKKQKFRQKWLFARYNKTNGLPSVANVAYTSKPECLDLKEIANFPANFAEHCVGEIQGLSQEICAYGKITCPIKDCDEQQVDVDHISNHQAFVCSLCSTDKQYGNLKAFKKHFTDYHVPTHYCTSCGNLCSESPPHKNQCKNSVAVNRKYIRLFFSSPEPSENNTSDCSCQTQICLKNDPTIVKALQFASLTAVVNVCYSEDEITSIGFPDCLRKVFSERVKCLADTENIDCAMSLFEEYLPLYLPL